MQRTSMQRTSMQQTVNAADINAADVCAVDVNDESSVMNQGHTAPFWLIIN